MSPLGVTTVVFTQFPSLEQLQCLEHTDITVVYWFEHSKYLASPGLYEQYIQLRYNFNILYSSNLSNQPGLIDAAYLLF